MHTNLTRRPLAGRPKSTAPGEPHRHLVGSLDAVEYIDANLIFESSPYRLAAPSDITFAELQRQFFETFNKWINATPAHGETADQWFERVVFDALFDAKGAA